MKKFMVMFGVIKEAIEMAYGRGDCIHCGKVFHQLDETLMDEPMALMILYVLLQKMQQICLLRKDLVFRNPAVTRILQDMINIMINMIFILVFLKIILERTDKILALLASVYSLMFDC
jgi:hypothetical protein